MRSSFHGFYARRLPGRERARRRTRLLNGRREGGQFPVWRGQGIKRLRGRGFGDGHAWRLGKKLEASRRSL